MKKAIIIASCCLLAIILGACLLFPSNNTAKGYLRIHIRANSNSNIDQTVKYKVKEAVVEYLTPLVVGASSANEAMKIVNNNLDGISAVATAVLEKNGFDYGAKAVLKDEYFPTRNYGDLVLENGYYDALIVNLGDGAGENWWCVVYPPLCFVSSGEGDIEYKSLIKEIIEKIRRGKTN